MSLVFTFEIIGREELFLNNQISIRYSTFVSLASHEWIRRSMLFAYDNLGKNSPVTSRVRNLAQHRLFISHDLSPLWTVRDMCNDTVSRIFSSLSRLYELCKSLFVIFFDHMQYKCTDSRPFFVHWSVSSSGMKIENRVVQSSSCRLAFYSLNIYPIYFEL